jgi:hypothetical protein
VGEAAEITRMNLKEHEDRLREAHYRKQLGRGVAQMGFTEMREGLQRLR